MNNVYKFKNVLKGGVLAALLVSVAMPSYAADAVVQPDPVYEAPEAVTEPVATYSWSGAYLGAYGGYTKGKLQSTGTRLLDPDGLGGGVYGGYNFQSDNIVYGLEGDIGYSGAKDSDAVSGLSAKQGFNGAVKGRLGYDLGPALLYGSAGVAATKFKANDGTTSDSNTHIGWTAGVGTEYKLTDNISTRLEYNYQDFNDKDYNLTAGSVPVDFKSHNVRIGVGMKF